MEKPVTFRDTALEDLRSFPADARQEAGYQIGKVQQGEEPTNWKPMPTVGVGVREIRIHEDGEAYRVMYIATFPEAVYVLHCFHKKTQKTSTADMRKAVTRFKALVAERARGK